MVVDGIHHWNYLGFSVYFLDVELLQLHTLQGAPQTPGHTVLKLLDPQAQVDQSQNVPKLKAYSKLTSKS
jgi:hypothetical protein